MLPTVVPSFRLLGTACSPTSRSHQTGTGPGALAVALLRTLPPPAPPPAAGAHPTHPWHTLPPSQVVCVRDGLPTWICEFMVSRGNIHEAIEYVKQIEQEVQKAMVIE